MQSSSFAAPGIVGRVVQRLFGGSLRRTLAVDPGDLFAAGQRFTIAPDVQTSVHKGGLALLNVATGRVFLCNQTGAQVWQGLSDSLSPDAICAVLSLEYGVSRRLVEQDVAKLLLELLHQEMIAPRRPH